MDLQDHSEKRGVWFKPKGLEVTTHSDLGL